ncbi:MAG: hypothetical protein OXC11_02370 [Rhodospirillales bacterium]|nr:hypothetical protein [Rhodospirillales bacterium]
MADIRLIFGFVLSIVWIVGIFVTGYFNPVRQAATYVDDYQVERCEERYYSDEYCTKFQRFVRDPKAFPND